MGIHTKSRSPEVDQKLDISCQLLRHMKNSVLNFAGVFVSGFRKKGRRNGVVSDLFRFLVFSSIFFRFLFRPFFCCFFFRFLPFFLFFFRFLPFPKRKGETLFARPLLRNPDCYGGPLAALSDVSPAAPLKSEGSSRGLERQTACKRPSGRHNMIWT